MNSGHGGIFGGNGGTMGTFGSGGGTTFGTLTPAANLNSDEIKLLQYNKKACLYHILSLVGLFVAYNLWSVSKSLSTRNAYRYQLAGPPPDTDPPPFDPSLETPLVCTSNPVAPEPGQCNVEPNFQAPKKVFSFNVIWACFAFFAFTAVAHAWYASDRGYINNVRQGWNPLRWLEFAVSASLMTVIIGLIDGANDASLLWALFIMTAAMQFCGYTTESVLRQPGRVNTTAIMGSTTTGWLLFLGLWSILLYSFLIQVNDVDTKYKGVEQTEGPQAGKPIKVPSWIIIVILIQLVNYFLFGAVQYQHIQERLKGSVDFIKYEHKYIALSFIAKIGLAAGIGYGLIFRVKNC